MPRDPTVQRIFLTTDDALQGLWGLQSYVAAAVDVADQNRIKERLPDSTFQITHEWLRYYDRDNLLKAMEAVFEAILCQQSLVTMVATFEGAVARMNKRVRRVCPVPKREIFCWVFDIVQHSNRGSKSMIERLPDVCGDVDHARRLRNCIVHNNGRYDRDYIANAKKLKDSWIRVKSVENAEEAVRRGFKILLTTPMFERLLRSHIELLHILHNSIQFTVFKHPEDYKYSDENKVIEWHRILTGDDSGS